MPKTADPTTMCPFGKKVDQKLKEKNMTQSKLARRLFINPVYLNQMMQGRYPVSMRMAVMIAKELDTDALELVGTILEGAGQNGA